MGRGYKEWNIKSSTFTFYMKKRKYNLGVIPKMGLWSYWYPDGKLWYDFNYVNGVEEGECIDYEY